MNTEKELAARRLSAALGKKITADDVGFLSDRGLVELTGDRGVYMLMRGNAAYVAGTGILLPKRQTVGDRVHRRARTGALTHRQLTIAAGGKLDT